MPTYGRMGTLCDEPNCLTCSFYIAREWGGATEILPYPTYEEAAEAVKAGLLDACLVAGAYPRINGLIFDEGLVVRESFVMQIPPLVLVSALGVVPDDLRVLYHHPATTPLLAETGLTYQPTELVTSNSMACKKLLASPEDSMAITNQICADHYQLPVHKVLRPGTKMPWVVFVRAD
jgi:prephenate dehydratase